MADKKEEITVVSLLNKKIIELEKREAINVVMRIDEVLKFLKEVRRVAIGEKVVTSIAITTPPTKTSYAEGDVFDPTGMVVTATYEDGTTGVVTDYTYYPTSSLTTSDTQITVSYGGKSDYVSITVSGALGPNQFKIVNNSSNDVEIYYEEDKEEYGNTTIMSGATVTITLEHFSWDTPYYIRYASGGSLNSHVFNGVYQGVTETNLEVGYYDGNILPPHESKTDTRWVFESGDGGTLTISSGSPSSRIVTYDGTNPVAYGADADNLIEY